MNILFFSRLFYPHIGGVEKHVFEIGKILIKKGHKIIVVTEQNSPELKLFEIFEGIKIFRIPKLKENKVKKFKIWRWLWVNRKLIANADIVHCHDVFFWYLPFRFLYLTKRIFTTFHGYENYPLKPKDILMHKISEKLSKGNICIGDFIKKWYGTKATYTTYGGVGISSFIRSPRSGQISNKVKNESALFVGRLDEQTGIKTYINAIKLIRKKIPDFKFEIIGDGKLRKEIEKDFRVIGFKKNPEKYFSDYNFAFVSRYLSILETLAAKRLVFAVYDNPLKGDYLKLTPFSKYIIICNSSSELASKTFFYLKNSNKKEKIINDGYEWVKKQTWEEVVKIYLKLWKTEF